MGEGRELPDVTGSTGAGTHVRVDWGAGRAAILRDPMPG
jgi:hypothetical protein